MWSHRDDGRAGSRIGDRPACGAMGVTGSVYLHRAAAISADGLYRYRLSRRLSRGDRTVLFVGLNPSTADASLDDPTIRRCVGFARSWAFDRLLMGNVYAFRSTSPKVLSTVDDPVGPLNRDALQQMAQSAEVIVAAWGKNRLDDRARELADWVLSLHQTRCLGTNKDGSPKHPLYLSGQTALRPVARL